jgi:hypothetical protein
VGILAPIVVGVASGVVCGVVCGTGLVLAWHILGPDHGGIHGWRV